MKFIAILLLSLGVHTQAQAAAGSEYVLLGAGTSYILIQATGGVVRLNQNNKDIASSLADEEKAASAEAVTEYNKAEKKFDEKNKEDVKE